MEAEHLSSLYIQQQPTMSKRKATEKEPEDVEMASHEDDDSGSDGDEVGISTLSLHSFN